MEPAREHGIRIIVCCLRNDLDLGSRGNDAVIASAVVADMPHLQFYCRRAMGSGLLMLVDVKTLMLQHDSSGMGSCCAQMR